MQQTFKHYSNFRLVIVAAILMALAVTAISVYTYFIAGNQIVRVSAIVVAALAVLTSFFVSWNSLRLHKELKRQRENYNVAEDHYFNVLCEVMMVVEARDQYLAGRSRRMSQRVAEIAAEMGLDKEYARLLGMIARVHDIGLLSVPAEVMGKAGRLTTAEFNIIKRHCRVGCHVLQQLSFLQPVLDAVLYHHERMNGTGYPEGLIGEDIPVGARILAVADSYDAMTHDRPHRNALSSEMAIAELVRCSGPGYDKDVVIALAKTLRMTEAIPEEWLQNSPVAPL